MSGIMTQTDKFTPLEALPQDVLLERQMELANESYELINTITDAEQRLRDINRESHNINVALNLG